MKSQCGSTCLVAALTCLAAAAAASAQQSSKSPLIPRMVSPAIDIPGQPFSYPSHPTDQISVMYAPAGTEVTPQGSLYTGYGELIFYLGIDREPISARIRTLEDGYLPVIHFTQQHAGVDYSFTIFAASLGQAQDGAHVANFVRITTRSSDGRPRNAFITAAWRYQAEQSTAFPTGDNRFQRPVAATSPGGYSQPGQPFNSNAQYTAAHGAWLQDNKAIYLFPTSPQPLLRPTLNDFYNFSDMAPVGLTPEISPSTPVAIAEYQLSLTGSEQHALDFIMPLAPINQASPEYAALKDASFDDRLLQVRSFWRSELEQGINIETPEAKVNDTFKTSLVNDLMSLNRVDGQTIQTINQLHYHGFYLRDSADFVRMYDTSNYSAIGGEVLKLFADKQGADGNFLSQPGQYDGWGETLWTYGEHYRITHDKQFAAEVYPRIQRAVQWLIPALQQDPLHLMPATDVRDNEFVPGHLTGYNFLALDGLRAAELLAHDLSHPDDEKLYQEIEQHLRAALMAQLSKVSHEHEGAIPPCLDPHAGGTDWGNLLSVVPEPQLDPWDPMVTATLRKTQANYQEGLITYHQDGQGTYLHHYLVMKNTQTELVRGEQAQAIRELYAVLLHTSSTNAGWEYSIRPWGDRDFHGNLAPHGWFAAEYRNLLRNMMVREQGTTLHLLSAVSPQWIGSGKRITVDRAATYFGLVGFHLNCTSGTTATLDVHIDSTAPYAPERVIVHMPWFLEPSTVKATANGKPLLIQSGELLIPAGIHHIDFEWKIRPLGSNEPESYDREVSLYKAEYVRRYVELTGDSAGSLATQ